MLKANAQITDVTVLPIRERIVEAALATLKEEGFAGTSARAIARRGDFNQALVFYHFGSVHDLLLAAFDATSARRLHEYRTAVAEAASVEELVTVALENYRRDLASGHITVLSEMIAGSLAHPDLAPLVVARMQPWIDFAEEMIRSVLAGSMFEGLLSETELAFAIVALYLGIDLLTHLDPDRREPEALFAAAERLAPLFTGKMGTTA